MDEKDSSGAFVNNGKKLFNLILEKARDVAKGPKAAASSSAGLCP